ncbi:c-type cytochrome [Sulfurospirillum sp. 1612]|uniref:c-type cytochrome n=1 Tax=Sulfurospirillum sp. 1612 TaxID=3094835 RepID=UPI002F91F78A
MTKHIIAAAATLLTLAAFIYMFNSDVEVQKMKNIATLIEKSKIEVKLSNKNEIKQEIKQETSAQSNKKEESEMDKKLKALKDKAGNMAAINVSPLYKKNCSSCHGTVGEGIIGSKLIGRSHDYILKALMDFKSGARKNYVMYGLLGNLNQKQLEELSTEISLFQEKLDAATKK